MSEAELHVLRARLRGGIENKARRGELRMRLPVGLVYDNADRIVLHPDQRVQDAIGKFFKTFEEAGSATGTVKVFRREGWKFPRKRREDLTREKSCGVNWHTAARCKCCTTHATQARLCLDGLSTSSHSRRISGIRFCRTRIPATSPGISLNVTVGNWR